MQQQSAFHHGSSQAAFRGPMIPAYLVMSAATPMQGRHRSQHSEIGDPDVHKAEPDGAQQHCALMCTLSTSAPLLLEIVIRAL